MKWLTTACLRWQAVAKVSGKKSKGGCSIQIHLFTEATSETTATELKLEVILTGIRVALITSSPAENRHISEENQYGSNISILSWTINKYIG